MTQSEKHIMDEITEHIVFEKLDTLKGDHFLTKKEKEKKKEKKAKEQKNKKSNSEKKSESGSFLFYSAGLSIIGLELWYLYNYAMINFPHLVNWIHFKI